MDINLYSIHISIYFHFKVLIDFNHINTLECLGIRSNQISSW